MVFTIEGQSDLSTTIQSCHIKHIDHTKIILFAENRERPRQLGISEGTLYKTSYICFPQLSAPLIIFTHIRENKKHPHVEAVSGINPFVRMFLTVRFSFLHSI